MAEVESEEITSDSDIQLAEDNSKAVSNYDEACNDYHNTEVERTNNLNNMQKIIKRLLKKGNVAIGTQTEPINFMSNSAGSLGMSGDLLSNEHERNHIVVTPVDSHHNGGGGAGDGEHSNLLSVGGPRHSQGGTLSQSRYTRPMSNSMYLHTLPNRLQTIDQDKLVELNARLNMLLAVPIKKLKAKEKKEAAKGSSGANSAYQHSETTDKQNVGNWVCPSMVLVFLQNAIEANTSATAGQQPDG